jgi:hypothetical protein
VAILIALKDGVLLSTTARRATKRLRPASTSIEPRIIREAEVKDVLVSIFQKPEADRDKDEQEIWQIRSRLADSLTSIDSWDDTSFKVTAYNAGVVLGYFFVIKVDSQIAPHTTRSIASAMRSVSGASGQFAFAVYFPNSTAITLLSTTKRAQSAKAKHLYSFLEYNVKDTKLCGFSLMDPHQKLLFGCIELNFEETEKLDYLRGALQGAVRDAEMKNQGGEAIVGEVEVVEVVSQVEVASRKGKAQARGRS